MLCAWPSGLLKVGQDFLIFTRESPTATQEIWSKIVHCKNIIIYQLSIQASQLHGKLVQIMIFFAPDKP